MVFVDKRKVEERKKILKEKNIKKMNEARKAYGKIKDVVISKV